MKYYLILTVCLAPVFIFTGCSSTEIVNLRTAKDIVQDYYESGKYDEEMNDVIKEAKEKFNKIEINNNSAVIFDVDDTALSNYEISKRLDFGYDKKIIDEWVLNAKLPAIKQVKELYHFLLSKNVKLIFLTGRLSEEYDVTYKNLVEQGYARFDTLIVRSKDQKKTQSQIFKTGVRKSLTKAGYEIIGTVGDQWTDLEGAYSGVMIKLPNYIYLIQH